jgi:ribonucleoside-diphosphate reductase alpha chain
MCGEAYAQSGRLAAHQGPFDGYAKNSTEMLKVIGKHRSHAYKIDPAYVPLDLLAAARGAWDEAYAQGQESGYRNSQATVLAPTGTIAFMMDCDTTGVEPDIALVKYKKLVGGGMLKIVNSTVPRALKRLGYESGEIQEIIDYIDQQDTIEGAPQLKEEDLSVFDCAFKPANGQRSIHHLGHLRMMGAVQPFISGAISKTINMPTDATVDDIMSAYVEAWRLGVKAVAIYRDGCKRTQPLNTAKDQPAKATAASAEAHPTRRHLGQDCRSIRHKFDIAGHEGYIHVGLYDDGSPGEIFIKIAKEGSTISGLMDTIGILTSMALQYGVPLDVLVNKFSHVRFEPSGFTKNPEIPIAKSLIDYIFRFIGSKFLDSEGQAAAGIRSFEGEEIATRAVAAVQSEVDALGFSPQSDAPSCADCGAIMIRNGSCYKCLNCGATSGCS